MDSNSNRTSSGMNSKYNYSKKLDEDTISVNSTFPSK